MKRPFEKRKTCDHISFLTENRGLYAFTWSLTEGKRPMSMCSWGDAVYRDEISTIYPSFHSQGHKREVEVQKLRSHYVSGEV